MPGMPIWPNNRRNAKKQALFDEVAMTHFHGPYYACMVRKLHLTLQEEFCEGVIRG